MKGLFRSLGRGSPALAPVSKKQFPIVNVPLTVSGATGNGFGTAVIGDFPEGNILLLGAIAYVQFSTASATVTATWTGSYAIGSAPNADADLTDATDFDIIPAVTLAAATAKLSPIGRGAQPAQAILDNTDGSLELNLNLLIDDATVSADGNAVVANGFVEVLYSVMGDD